MVAQNGILRALVTPATHLFISTNVKLHGVDFVSANVSLFLLIEFVFLVVTIMIILNWKKKKKDQWLKSGDDENTHVNTITQDNILNVKNRFKDKWREVTQ